jgi:hypothetical protein
MNFEMHPEDRRPAGRFSAERHPVKAEAAIWVSSRLIVTTAFDDLDAALRFAESEKVRLRVADDDHLLVSVAAFSGTARRLFWDSGTGIWQRQDAWDADVRITDIGNGAARLELEHRALLAGLSQMTSAPALIPGSPKDLFKIQIRDHAAYRANLGLMRESVGSIVKSHAWVISDDGERRRPTACVIEHLADLAAPVVLVA